MKFRSILAAAAAAALVWLATGCDTKEKDIAVTGVSLAPTSLTLNIGESQALTATVSPTNATNKALNWTTDDPSMNVIVINEGTVKGVGAGTAKVTVTTQDGGFTATCNVMVNKADDPGPGPGPGPDKIEVEAISLGQDDVALVIGEELSLSAKVSPTNATDADKIVWASSNSAVASVSGNGKDAVVKALSEGAADITATAEGTSISATCKVTVSKGEVAVESVALDGPAEALVGDEAVFTASFLPEDATNADGAAWSIEGAQAEMSTAGLKATVTFLAEGTVSLSVTIGGLTANKTISVTAPAPQFNAGELVDLGLPSGTLWCAYNLGATEEDLYGGLFAWGETQAKEAFLEADYKFFNGNYQHILKYNVDSGYGDVDNRTVLEPEDDAATAILGENYRMPTLGEFEELVDPANCSHQWTTVNGFNGMLFTSKHNGKTLFLPAAGWGNGSVRVGAEEELDYWVSTLATNSVYEAWYWYANNTAVTMPEAYYYYRESGMSVRAVSAPRPVLATGISASPKEVYLQPGESVQLSATITPSNAPQRVYWHDPYYPYGDYKLDAITGLLADWQEKTTYSFLAVDGTSGWTDIVSVIPDRSHYAVPEAVDLGLKSGTLWASWDLGASTPEEPGYHFAWGETEPKDVYSTQNYLWYDVEAGVYTKYDYYNRFLEPEDDAAAVHLGGDWRIPTQAQVEELITHSSMETTTINGMPGQLLTGPNLKTIFLPFGGYVGSEGMRDFGVRFDYHTCELYSTSSSYYFYWTDYDCDYEATNYRTFGNCIRAVIPPTGQTAAPVNPAAAVRALGPVRYDKKMDQPSSVHRQAARTAPKRDGKPVRAR